MSTNASIKAQSWPGTSSQLASGAGTAVNVSPASALSGSVIGAVPVTTAADDGRSLIIAGGAAAIAYGGLRTVYDLRAANMTGGSIADGGTVTLTDSLGRACTATAQVADNSTMTINSSGVTCAWSSASSVRDSYLKFPLTTWSQNGDAGVVRVWVWVSSFWADFATAGATYVGMRMWGTAGIPYVCRQQDTSTHRAYYTDGAIAFQNNHANFGNADVFIFEQFGSYTQVRCGTWSSGWPALGATRILYATYPSTTLLNTASNGAGVDLSAPSASMMASMQVTGARTCVFGAIRVDC